MANPQRSIPGLEPYELDGLGSGCEPVMKMDSERGVWFPPRPREGGTPTNLDGLGALLGLANSLRMMDSTSSM